MPNSPEPTSWVHDIEICLKELNASTRLEMESVCPGLDPLLIMSSDHRLAAFGIGNGNARSSYGTLYEGFKSLYLKHQKEWHSRELSFVFCVKLETSDLQQLCSEIETDVYFCRKFVIPLVQPIGIGLARLPFIPLTPIKDSPSRPPSAQTYLQRCGVSATLAKHIVHHGKAPEGIIEECLSGSLGVAKELKADESTVVQNDDSKADAAVIERVTITNFRAYRKPMSFMFGKDVTFFYGPNGFGKTSLFDALDFVVTGGIGRLDRAEKRFEKMARHLDSGSESSEVSLTFRSKDTIHTLIRSTNDRNQALLNSVKEGRKNAIAALTGGTLTDRIERSVSLFRATHLFSQEHQELTKDLICDSTLSNEIVSQMLAFEDYTNANRKANRILDVINSILKKELVSLDQLAKDMEIAKSELQQLSQATASITDHTTISHEYEVLKARAVSAGLDADSASPDIATLQQWRSALEAKAEESRGLSARLSSLIEKAGEYAKSFDEVAALQRETEDVVKKKTELEGSILGLQEVLENAQQERSDLTLQLAEATESSEFLKWAHSTVPQIAQLREAERACEEEIKPVQKQVATLKDAEQKLLQELAKVHIEIAAMAERISQYHVDIQSFTNLRQAIPTWDSNRRRLDALVRKLREEFDSRESLVNAGASLEEKLSPVRAEVTRLEFAVSELERTQSELNTLKSQFQAFVTTSACPLCGIVHGTKEDLLASITKEAGSDTISPIRSQYQNAQKLQRELEQQLEENQDRMIALDQRVEAAEEERNALLEVIGSFEHSAFDADISIEGAVSSIESAVDLRITRLKDAVAQVEEKKKTLARTAEALQDELLKIGASLADAERIAWSLQARREESIEGLARIEDDARFDQLNQTPADIAEIDRQFKAEQKVIEELRGKIKNADELIRARQHDTETAKNKLQALVARIAQLEAEVSKRRAIQAATRVMLQGAGVPPETAVQALPEMIAEETRKHEGIHNFKNSVFALELALDAATTAAALTSLRKTLREKEELHNQLKEKREKLKPWAKYFKQIKTLLASREDLAIREFTSQYGPRATIIQQRLRSVYGFENIEIDSSGSLVNVSVKRHGESLPPGDYFSQSQQQTLILSLFLTSCSSQTWSTFAPVLLDDPVTHFDDLNTFSFLDLICGLIKSEMNKKQFIISTCDDRFLQLAIQKFRHLGDRAKFYKFTAFGADGPVVESISIPEPG